MTRTESDASSVVLRELVYRQEGEGWTVGCAAVAAAIDIPEIGVTVLRQLAGGATFGEAADAAYLAHGARPDVEDFVEGMLELGFAVRLEDAPAEDQDGGRSLPWLSTRVAQMLFHPAAICAAAVLVVLSFARAVAAHRIGLGYERYFAFRYPGLSAVWSTAVVMFGVSVHELSHLAAARAEGIPARLSLGTRLFRLTPQTSAPLMWTVDRRSRLRFFLAGMGADVVLAAIAATALVQTRPGTAPSAMSGSALLVELGMLAGQFVFCVRTDMYLVIQELSRCRNLHGDALDFARHIAARSRTLTRLDRRVAGFVGREDPTRALPLRERRPVRVYAVFMVVGCAVVLALSLGYGLPIELGLVLRSIEGVASARVPQVLDGLALLIVEIGAQVLLVRVLLRNR